MDKAQIQIERLSPDERQELETRLKRDVIFTIIAIVMSVVFFAVGPNDKIYLIGLGVFWSFFYGILIYLIQGSFRDLKSNEKIIVKGFISDRISKSGTRQALFQEVL